MSAPRRAPNREPVGRSRVRLSEMVVGAWPSTIYVQAFHLIPLLI